MQELNSYVHDEITSVLRNERKFYESDTRDKLKVPPFAKIMRGPRDYVNEENIILEYKKQM